MPFYWLYKKTIATSTVITTTYSNNNPIPLTCIWMFMFRFWSILVSWQMLLNAYFNTTLKVLDLDWRPQECEKAKTSVQIIYHLTKFSFDFDITGMLLRFVGLMKLDIHVVEGPVQIPEREPYFSDFDLKHVCYRSDIYKAIPFKPGMRLTFRTVQFGTTLNDLDIQPIAPERNIICARRFLNRFDMLPRPVKFTLCGLQLKDKSLSRWFF